MPKGRLILCNKSLPVSDPLSAAEIEVIVAMNMAAPITSLNFKRKSPDKGTREIGVFLSACRERDDGKPCRPKTLRTAGTMVNCVTAISEVISETPRPSSLADQTATKSFTVRVCAA